MRTNIELDEKLVRTGLSVTGCKTKKDLVHLALRELVRRKRIKEILKFVGKVDWEGDLSKVRGDGKW